MNGVNALDDPDQPDEPEAPLEFEQWQQIGERYRELAHELRGPLMGLRRQLSAEPREALAASARISGGRVVSQTQGVVDQLEDLADRSERLAWESYHEYLLKELNL